jgi:hypothetical protein
VTNDDEDFIRAAIAEDERQRAERARADADAKKPPEPEPEPEPQPPAVMVPDDMLVDAFREVLAGDGRRRDRELSAALKPIRDGITAARARFDVLMNWGAR